MSYIHGHEIQILFYFKGLLVKLAKNVDPDKYVYTDYGIGFNSRSEISLPGGSVGKNVIAFGADMSSSLHISYKEKDILIPGKSPTQGLDDTTLTTSSIFN